MKTFVRPTAILDVWLWISITLINDQWLIDAWLLKGMFVGGNLLTGLCKSVQTVISNIIVNIPQVYAGLSSISSYLEITQEAEIECLHQALHRNIKRLPIIIRKVKSQTMNCTTM